MQPLFKTRQLVSLVEKQREQPENTQNNPGNENSGANNSSLNNKTNNNNNNKYKNSNRADKKLNATYPPGETCGGTNHSTEKCYFGANAANRQPPRHRRPNDRIRHKKKPIKVTQMKLLNLQPKIQTKNTAHLLWMCD